MIFDPPPAGQFRVGASVVLSLACKRRYLNGPRLPDRIGTIEHVAHFLSPFGYRIIAVRWPGRKTLDRLPQHYLEVVP